MLKIRQGVRRRTSFSLPTSISVRHSCLGPLLVRLRRWLKNGVNWISANKDWIVAIARLLGLVLE